MTITDEDYNKISDTAYWIDPIHNKYDPKIKKTKLEKLMEKSTKFLMLNMNPKTECKQWQLWEWINRIVLI
ncbi:hypothetical protein UAY_03402 [Enterococcus moraviensis ATCC BAA-383]|uniref:Uncharacterized protein n=1 Tax=Enterococcus moraviensis ATCC BAA-383 TaxID=1158609 RepID=R2QFC8_9ENTE|nr:hypothetical protein [Enterococcus moraviensis]EOH95212.1 hypothetical protein UAY_03402 [Enterococcus moraviensis ATCC BAA-383]EOT65142.1 hypothetical protein I586_02876 [Enterococcus moraviensis ATCC BAA-383]